MSEIIPLFSKTVFVDQINVDQIYSKLKNNKLSINRKDKNLSDVALEYDVLQREELKNLNLLIIKKINFFLNKSKNYSNKFKITNSWITITKPKQKSHKHRHFNSMYSGVVYLQTDEKSGDIEFENFIDNSFKLNVSQYNIFNSNVWKIKPQNGMILIFPSDMYHQVLENTSNIDRVSLAFNILPIGDLSYGDNFLKL